MIYLYVEFPEQHCNSIANEVPQSTLPLAGGSIEKSATPGEIASLLLAQVFTPSCFTLRCFKITDHSRQPAQLLYSNSLTRTLHRTCSIEKEPLGLPVSILMLQTSPAIAILVALQELASTSAP